MTESESPPNTQIDNLSELLEDPHRRAAIVCLAERRAPVGLCTLAGQILESVGPPWADHEPVDVERMAIALHHNHLPRLADSGLVEYDVERRTVRIPRDETRVMSRPERAGPAVSDFDRRRGSGDSIDRAP